MTRILPFLLTALLLLSYCAESPTERHDASNILPSGTEGYLPPVFEVDRRVKHIRDIAPDIHQIIQDRAEKSHIPGIAYGVVVDDELVIASALGMSNLEKNIPAGTNTAFRIASMSKSFTAMAIMKLRDEGRLKLSDPASKYVPEMANLKYLTNDSPPVTIQNLLTMTAGFPEDNPWGDRQLDEPDQMLKDLISGGPAFSNPPSYAFEYSNTGYAILGLIIKNVSEMPYQEYIRDNILHPLSMFDTRWEYDNVPIEQLSLGYRWEDDRWKPEPMLHDGSYGAMGGLITTINDFSKYVSFHLSAWPPRNAPDNGPIKRSTLREMQTPHYPELDAFALDGSGNPCAGISGYGYGLSVYEDCTGIKRISHGGALPGFGSHYAFFPDYGIGIMAFGNLTYTRPYDLDGIQNLIFENSDIRPREIQASEILEKRMKQVAEFIQSWDPELEKEILAENFYLDKSREHRRTEMNRELEKAGQIINIDRLTPFNQLRGEFYMITENGQLEVFFTLTPENDPRVQFLHVAFIPGSPDKAGVDTR